MSAAAVNPAAIDTPDRCPDCGGDPVARCRCPVGDAACAAGHRWHRCAGCRRPIRGEADHARPTWDHLCAPCRKDRAGVRPGADQ